MATNNSQKKPKRIRKEKKIILLFSLILFLIGGAAIYILVNNRFSPVDSKQTTQANIVVTATHEDISIPVPSRIITRGEKLSELPITYINWPADRIGNNYITDLSKYKDTVIISQLPALMPIPISSVSIEGLDINAVVDSIPPGMRAITVKADAESAVEGWARSGNYVDVIVIKASAESAIGLEAKVIAENIKILSANSSVEPVNGGSTAPKAPNTVTLLVTQEDALKIKTAMNVGKLTFSLRGTGDQSPTQYVTMDQKRLLGGAKTAVKIEEEFKGFAKAPDGKTYILTDRSRWLEKNDTETKPLARLGQLTTNKQ